MIKLSDLLTRIEVLETRGDLNTVVSDIHIDSRKVGAGHLFVAIPGTVSDGHQFIPKAIEQGAAAIVQSQPLPESAPQGVAFVRVADTEACVGLLATEYYGRPSEHLALVGVTGTNGKTTIATTLYNLFRGLGFKVGLLSTVCNFIDTEKVPASHTTPDPITLNALLRRMADAGCTYVFMECSSHAIQQHRIGGLHFRGGIFTNLTRDHLDYHKTFENYRDAKKRFFDELGPEAFALTNADDRNGIFMLQNTKAVKHTYSTRSMADFQGRIVEESIEGMLLTINRREVSVQFVGSFNVQNLLAIYGTAILLGQDETAVLEQLSLLRPVNGRFETIRSPKGVSGIIDYAHTPDALANVLHTIADVLHGRGRIITVCGAGGNRDKGKRPIMAQEAAKGSQIVILTSDNPRNENPDDIISEMFAGLDEEQRTHTLCITDRRQAIRTAVAMAREGDVILVAGKGHETYQEINGVKHHFDDHEELRNAFGLTC